jgi:uncharacterized membrane protein required for colicin V production
MPIQLCAGWQRFALDGVVIVLLLIIGLKDGKKGFVECLFSLVSVFAAAAFAFLFMKLLLVLTGDLFGLKGVLEQACVRAFSNIKGFDFDVSNQGISAALADKNIPAFLIDAVVEEFGHAEIPVGTTIAMLVGTSLGGIITGLIAWIILFIVGKLILFIVKKFLIAIIKKIPLVGKIDRILGFVVGILKGGLIVCAVLAVISIIPSAGLGEYFSKPIFIGWLYNHNPINEILSWILV